MSRTRNAFQTAAHDKNFIADCEAKGDAFLAEAREGLEQGIWVAIYTGYLLGKYGPEHCRGLSDAASVGFDETGRPVCLSS